MKRTPLKRKTPLERSTWNNRTSPLRSASKKRAAQLREYAKKRKAYLEAHPFCEVTRIREGLSRLPASTEIHHVRGRVGSMLNDERYWLAACRAILAALGLPPVKRGKGKR